MGTHFFEDRGKIQDGRQSGQDGGQKLKQAYQYTSVCNFILKQVREMRWKGFEA